MISQREGKVPAQDGSDDSNGTVNRKCLISYGDGPNYSKILISAPLNQFAPLVLTNGYCLKTTYTGTQCSKNYIYRCVLPEKYIYRRALRSTYINKKKNAYTAAHCSKLGQIYS